MSDKSTKREKVAVTWFEALNEQVEWVERSLMLRWLTGVFGFQLEPTSECEERFVSSLRKMRLDLGAAHFDKFPNLSWLDDELKMCRPRLSTESVTNSRLPAFRAAVSGLQSDNSEADNCIEQLRLTLLMQFAEFIGSTIDGGAAKSSPIDRCRGLYRDDSKVPEPASFPAAIEKRWRDEIALLQENESAAVDVIRCEYFFPKTAKARFCSDSCRFSTFQITKQLQEPNYLADKQKRYRLGKKP